MGGGGKQLHRALQYIRFIFTKADYETKNNVHIDLAYKNKT